MISFINDSGSHLKVTEEVLITRQVANFKNFNIKGDYSISFTVENNSETREALGYYGLNQVNSPVLSSSEFNLLKNGTILMRGYIVIEEDNGDTLSLYFISGNSNWFAEFDFNCRDIRTDRWNVQWYSGAVSVYNCVYESVGKTEGIVFPYIDWAFKGQKADRYILDYYPKYNDESFTCFDYFPCVYLHTLIDELANHSGVKITGTLLEDKFFKTLILTPDSPDIYDPETNTLLQPNSALTTESEVKIQAVAPNMTALELIKWCCISFGVSPIYDTFSKTLTLNILDKLPLQGKDWSSFVKGYQLRYDQVQNNIVTVTQDPIFDDYNAVNDLSFGSLNIQSQKLDAQTKELYTSPFATCYDWTSDTGRQSLVYIPMYNLEDDQTFAFTDVDNEINAGYDDVLELTGSGYPFITGSLVTPIRVLDDDLLYEGYHRLVNYPVSNGATSLFITGQVSAGAGTYPGNFFTQKVTKNKPGTRVLSFVTSIDYKQMSSFIDFDDVGKRRVEIKFAVDDDVDYELSNVPWAYYYKTYNQYYAQIRSFRQGLAYGEVQDYVDYTLRDIYFNKISKMVTSPTIRCNMLIPEKDFIDFNFEFIYINTGKINGWFFVDSIVNYKDSTTLCEVNLIQING
jgi:hypothetical protein